MSISTKDEMLVCATCNRLTLHHTTRDSDHESDVYAQCEHFGPELLSGPTEPQDINGLCYWFLLDQ